MEEFVVFRLFMAFPVIGLLIPDIGSIFTGYGIAHIPATHIIIEATLSICIAICSAGIKNLKRKENGKNTEVNHLQAPEMAKQLSDL